MALNNIQTLRPSVALLITYIALAIGAIILNTICIIAIAIQKRDLKPFEILLVNLMVVDIMVALSSMLLAIMFLVGPNETTKEGLHLMAFIFMATSHEMMLLVFLISMNRLIAVKYPLKHRIQMTKRKTSIISAITWLLSAMYLSVIITAGVLGGTSENPLKIPDVPRIAFIITMCIFTATLIAANIETLRLILRRNAAIRGNAVEDVSQGPPETFLCITTSLIIVCFCLCTAPKIHVLVQKKTDVRVIAALLVNTIVNPLLYFLNSRLRRRFNEASRRSQEQMREAVDMKL